MQINEENKANRGIINDIIISILHNGNKYGYEICKEIDDLSNNEVVIKQPSVYSSLRRLEKQGLIESFWDESDIGGKRHYYSLTTIGQDIYNKNKEDYNLEKLVASLPQYIEEDDDKIAVDTAFTDQEEIFNNISNNSKSIKDGKNNIPNSFMQLDLFDQSAKMVKNKKNKNQNTKKVKYSKDNFSILDNHSKEIEKFLTNNEFQPNSKKTDEISKENIFKDSPSINTTANNEKKIEENKEEDILKENDYKTVLSQMFNNSKQPDPYEKNKLYTFKEIFPSANLEKTKEEKKDIYDKLKNSSLLQSTNIRKYIPPKISKREKKYVDIKRLNMVTSWFTSFIILLEILFCYLILNNKGLFLKNQLLLYFLGAAIAISILFVFTLENFLDRFKLVSLKPNFKKGFIIRLIVTIFAIILVFALCLAFGMRSLLEKTFISFWLVPVFLISNLLVSYLIYFLLYRSKHFHS